MIPPHQPLVCPVIVGREQQRALVEEAVDGLRKGRGALVLISGDAGIGESRLVREKALTELAREAGFSSTVKVPLDNPLNNLYEIRP